MKVSIKSFDVEMHVKSKGVEFEVRSTDGSEFLGDCFLTMTGLIWCKGKTAKQNGQRLAWNDFIALMNDPDTLKAAVRAARKSQ